MKTVKLLLLVPAIVLMSFNYAGLTDSEREFAVKHLKETKKDLLGKVKGLSDAQLNFKATEESWSIAECVEHITKSENMIWGMVEGPQKGEPTKAENGMTDEALVGMITSREQKIKTQEMFKPTGAYASTKDAMKEFGTKRDEHIKYVQSTSADLRSYFNDMPFGKMDAYQAIIFMSGHTKRHTAQIEEVMANAKFPKK
ncbi:MAG: DinB family protein [Cyclobacteriaceae bacterium]